MHCYATKWRLGVCALAVGAGLMLACQSQETQEGLAPQLDSLGAGSQVQYQALGIEPASVTLAPGQSVTFQAVQWEAGVRSPFPYPFRWSATGGTITSSGVYKAGSTPGRYHVVAQGTTTSYWQEAIVTISATSATVTSINTCSGGTSIPCNTWRTSS